MFNELINDNVDVPSLGVLKLYFVLQDLYSNCETTYNLSPIDMQNIMNHYGDKYKHIDKVIMLVYGITSVNSYTLNEEKLDKSRFDPNELTDKEKQAKGNELITPQIVLDTNIGELVIGYDYAYIKKPTYTPNIELSEKTKTILRDERINYNIDYPYIFINPHNEYINVIPPFEYNKYIEMLDTTTDNNIYYINIKTLEMKRFYRHQPLTKTEDETIKQQNKPIEIDNYIYDTTFISKQTNNNENYVYLVEQHKNKQDENILYQLIIDNHYNVYNIYYIDSYYMCEKLYLKQTEITQSKTDNDNDDENNN